MRLRPSAATYADGSDDAHQTGYEYDSADKLTSVRTSGNGGPLDGAWAYDGVGNRKDFAGGTTANGMNQYANYTYNARGDCTSDGTWHYSYNALDRLTSAESDTQKVTFGYDAEARLTEADTWTPDGAGGWTLTNTTRFAWDGTNLEGIFDGSNTLLQSFAWGPTGLLEITDLAGPTPVTYVPVKDATGSIVQLLDTNGNVVADFHYDAWGVRTAAGPAAGACPFGFAGMLMDPTTGLYYDQARWYSASQGRFLTPDPSGAAGGLNLEAYCGNDPVNLTDPTGADSVYGTWWLFRKPGDEPGVGAAEGSLRGVPGNQASAQQILATRDDAIGRGAQAGSLATGLKNTRDGLGGVADGLIPFYSLLRHALGKDFEVDENGTIYAGGQLVGTVVQVVATANVAGVLPEGFKAIELGPRVKAIIYVGSNVAKVGSRFVGAGLFVSGALGTAGGIANAYDSFDKGQDLKGAFQAGTAALNAFQIFHGGYRAWRGWGEAPAGTVPAGKGGERAELYSKNWPSDSLDRAIETHAGPNYTSWETNTGKVIYENPSTGRQVVFDPDGNYFRIYQPKTIGGKIGDSLNTGGRIPKPARFTPNGIKNTDLRSLGPDGLSQYKAETHYNNADFPRLR